MTEYGQIYQLSLEITETLRQRTTLLQIMRNVNGKRRSLFLKNLEMLEKTARQRIGRMNRLATAEKLEAY